MHNTNANPIRQCADLMFSDRAFDFIRRMQIQHAKSSSTPLMVFPTVNDFFATLPADDPATLPMLNNMQFTIVGYKWMVTLAKSNALIQGITSLGQTRPIVNSLQALLDKTSEVRDFKEEVAPNPVDGEASDPGNGEASNPPVTRIINPISTVIDFLAAREWCRRRDCVEAREAFGQQNGTNDIPLDQATQKKLAGQLSLAAMNEVGMVDNLYHGKPGKKKLNYIIKRLRELPTLAVSLLGWEAVFDAIDSHLGISQVPIYTTDLEIQPYRLFTDRYEKMKELFSVSTICRGSAA